MLRRNAETLGGLLQFRSGWLWQLKLYLHDHNLHHQAPFGHAHVTKSGTSCVHYFPFVPATIWDKTFSRLRSMGVPETGRRAAGLSRLFGGHKSPFSRTPADVMQCCNRASAAHLADAGDAVDDVKREDRGCRDHVHIPQARDKVLTRSVNHLRPFRYADLTADSVMRSPVTTTV